MALIGWQAMMQTATTSLADARSSLIKLLGPKLHRSYLVGHSLENDLHALHLRRAMWTAVVVPPLLLWSLARE